MGNYELLKAAINDVIKANGRQEITGEVLNQVLLSMVNSLGAGYQCMGVATPSTNPGTPDQNVFYFATQAGTYTNFDAIVLQAGISVLIWNGDWASQTWFTVDSAPTNNSQNLIASGAVFNALKLDGGAYDVTAHNSGATFASLSALLNSSNLATLIPTEIRHGGMSIKFIQSSDNKYVQARCMAQNFTTDITQWQGVDDEPTEGSDNLVKSGGVCIDAWIKPRYLEGEEIHTTNLYDKDSLGCVVGKYVNYTNGNLESNANYKTSGYIPVTPGKTYIGNCGQCAFYNSNKEYISGFADIQLARTAPENAVYLRVSIFYYTISDATARINEGGVLQDYEPYLLKKNLALITTPDTIQTKNVADNAITIQKISGQVVKSTNLYNKDAEDCVIGKYVNYTNGNLESNVNYKTSGYIPVMSGNDYRANLSGQMAFFDANKAYVSGFADFNVTRQAPQDAAYMRVSIVGYVTADATAQVNAGTTLLPYEPYYDKKMNLDLITTPNPDSIVPAIPDNSIGVAKIDGTIAYSTNLYNKDAADCVTGKYVNYNNGNLENNANYKASGYIPVVAGNYYICNLGIGGMCAFYDANKIYIGGYADLTNARQAPNNAAYLRFSISGYTSSDATARVNEGTAVLPYEPYAKYIKNLELMTTPDSELLKEGVEKVINPLLYPGYVKVTSTELSSNGSLQALNYPYNARRGEKITMFANVTSWGAGIIIGKILSGGYATAWLEINATQIIAKVSYSSQQTIVVETIEHGLTIDTFVKVTIDIDADKWSVILQTLAGTYVGEVGIYEGNGIPTITSLGASLTNVEMILTNSYFNRPIWAFGDSYYGMTVPIRQLYWLKEWGYLNVFVDALAGINSENALRDLRRCLTIAKPKYLIWSLGMNDSTFAVWKTYADQVIELCEDNDITLILTTIPQPASSAVVEKDNISDWIRNSGIRYIDAAKAVGSDADGHWYGYGTAYNYQSDDNVHCSEYGAKAIATQFLVDVPEIMQ